MSNNANDETKSKSLQEISVGRCPSEMRDAPQTLSTQRSETKTLKNMIMDVCIRKFEKLFLEKSYDGTLTAKADVELGPNLFESLLERSRRLSCHIRPMYLKLCLARRDSLNWKKINLRYAGECSEGKFSERDLNIIFRSTLPVTELSFCTDRVSKGMLKQLSRCSSSLELLEIELGAVKHSMLAEVLSGKKYSCVYAKDEQIRMMKLPKLQYLSLHATVIPKWFLDILDLRSISTNLKVLKLINFVYNSDAIRSRQSVDLIDLIKNCRDLRFLSLFRSRFDKVDRLYEAVRSLKKLEILDMVFVENENSSGKISASLRRTISCMPSLIHLNVNCCIGKFANSAESELKQLKDFGRIQDFDPDYEAKLSGNERSLDGLFNFLKTSDVGSLKECALRQASRLYLNKISWNESKRTKLEKCLSRCLDIHPFLPNVSNCIKDLVDKITIEWSPNFRTKLSMHFDTLHFFSPLLKLSIWLTILIKDLADHGSSYIKWSSDFLAKLTRHFVGIHSISPRDYGINFNKYRSPNH